MMETKTTKEIIDEFIPSRTNKYKSSDEWVRVSSLTKEQKEFLGIKDE